MAGKVAVNGKENTPQRESVMQVIVALPMLVAALIFLVALVQAIQVARLPFLGAFIEPTLVVAGIGDENWSGRAAGLDYPDRLVKLDELPVTNPSSLYNLLPDLIVGATVDVEVELPDGSGRQIPVRLQSITAAAFAGFFVVPAAVGMVFLATALVVFAARRDRPVGRAFAIFGAAAALTGCTLFDLFTTHRLMHFWVLGMALIGGSLIYLGLVFPRRFDDAPAGHPRDVALSFVPSAALVLWGWLTVADTSHPWAYSAARTALYVFTVLALIVWVAILVRRRFRTDSPVVREQTRIILLSVLVAILPVGIWLFGELLGVLEFPPTILFVPLVLLPLSMAYATLRYRILDVDLLVSRGISYSLIGLFFVVAYVLVAKFVGWLLGDAAQTTHPLVVALFVFGAAVMFNPLRMRIQGWTDRLFYHERIDYQSALESYSHNLGRLLGQSDIFVALTKRVEQAVQPERLMFFVYDEASAQFAPLPDSLGPSKGVHFSASGGLARLLAEKQQTVYLMPGQPRPEFLQWETDQLEAVGAELYVPLPRNGWMALGAKRSGDPYTTDDLGYLEKLGDRTSLALDRVQLISDLERKVNELNALRWISQAIQFSVGLDDLLELIYNQTSRVLGIDNFYIALYDEAKQTLSFAFYVEKGERYYPTDEWPLEMGGLQKEIIRSGQPIVTEDYMAECLARGIPPGGKADRAWMGVPLNAGDRVIGVMTVSGSEPGVRYSPDQLSIFSAIADQAAAIIDRAWLDEEMAERTRQLATLNEVGSAINSSLDFQTVLQLLTEKAAEILEAESGSLWLTDPDTGDLVFQIAVGPMAESLVGLRLPMGKGIVGATALNQKPVIVNDTQKDERWFAGADESSGFISRAILSVPLVHKANTIGVLQILNKKNGAPFDQSDAQLMLAFGSQASVALENARLFTMTDQALAARVEELSTFQKIDYALNATLDYRQVIELTLDWAVQVTGAEVGSVLNLNEEQGGLFVVASQGYPPEYDAHRERPWSVNEGVVGRAVRNGVPEVVNDVLTDPDYVELVSQTRAELVVPLRVGDKVIGAINLESPNPGGFSDDDVQLASRLAERAVVPIQNAQLYEQVTRANEAKSQFVSMVAHELKIPMTSIKGYASLLEMTDGPMDDTKKGFIKTINANVDRMTKTVNDLLDISRIETGRLKLELDSVSVPAAIDETLASLRGAIEEKGLELLLTVPEDLPLVWGDRTRFVQILINLVSNATKYTPEGRIHIFAEALDLPAPDNGHTAKFVRCSVRDTGIGISKEDQERLFKSQFVRFENAVEVAPGHGLGLWLVNRLAELQGGQITFESKLGKGSTFSVVMPITEEQVWSPTGDE
jgi:signal transduction histidine kinase